MMIETEVVTLHFRPPDPLQPVHSPSAPQFLAHSEARGSVPGVWCH